MITPDSSEVRNAVTKIFSKVIGYRETPPEPFMTSACDCVVYHMCDIKNRSRTISPDLLEDLLEDRAVKILAKCGRKHPSLDARESAAVIIKALWKKVA